MRSITINLRFCSPFLKVNFASAMLGIILIILFIPYPVPAKSAKIILPGSQDPGSETLNLDLERSLMLAITNNYELKAINANKEVYNLSIMEQWREFFPTLSLAYLNNQNIIVRGADTREQTIQIDSNWLLYDGGQNYMKYQIAKLKAILARNDYRIAVNELIMQTTNAYLNLLQLKGVIEIHKKTLERGNIQLDLIKKELKLGEATRFQVMEIEAKVKGIELELEEAQDNYLAALSQFKFMLKLDWKQPINIKGDIDKDIELYQLKDTLVLHDLVAQAHKKRKEIESSKVDLSIKSKEYSLSKLYFLPKFSIGASYGLTGNEFMPREKEWGINFKVTSNLLGNTISVDGAYDNSENGYSKTTAAGSRLNICDSLDYQRNIITSKINKDLAMGQVSDTIQQVSIEVATSHMTLNNYWNMIHIAEKQLELYDTQLEIERIKANMGDSTRYDLMKKEIERGEAAISYLESKIRYIQAGSSLEMAMGVDIGYLKLSKIKAGINDER